MKLDFTSNFLMGKTFDLILTVTVLQALDSMEFDEALSFLSKSLNDGGFFISMEFFATPEINLQTKENKVVLSEWNSSIKKHNLKLVKEFTFYGQLDFPCQSWLKYKNNKILQLLKPFKRLTFVQLLFKSVAKRNISKYKDVLQINNGPFRIYVIKKINVI